MHLLNYLWESTWNDSPLNKHSWYLASMLTNKQKKGQGTAGCDHGHMFTCFDLYKPVKSIRWNMGKEYTLSSSICCFTVSRSVPTGDMESSLLSKISTQSNMPCSRRMKCYWHVFTQCIFRVHCDLWFQSRSSDNRDMGKLGHALPYSSCESAVQYVMLSYASSAFIHWKVLSKC